MINLLDDKNKEKKEEKKEIKTTPEVYTVKGTNLGDTKTIKVYPSGYIQIIDGGI